MSATIDDRIVSLEFDNQQFEEGVQESLDTLEKLKDSLKLEDAAKNLSAISDEAIKVDLSPISDSLDKLSEKFSTLRMVGLMALSHLVDGAMQLAGKLGDILSAPFAQIKNGGWSRAMNIEDAKFQLSGLGVAWEDVFDDIDYAVSGTAYGLDAAAKACAQFSTAGVEAGEDMKKALRGISGVAAMTNSAYEDIADVFTDISGKGKVSATDLNRLGQRGLNARAALATYFNEILDGSKESSESMRASVMEITEGLSVTEADIREFTKKGLINFDMFTSAMDDAFGEHAKKANDTFVGALSNIKAALSRIGEQFANPIIKNAIPLFNEIRLSVVALKNDMGPVFDIFSNFADIIGLRLKNAVASIRDVLESPAKAEWLDVLSDALYLAAINIYRIGQAISEAFHNVFTGSAQSKVVSFANGLMKLVRVLTPSDATLRGLTSTLTGLFTIIKTIITVIGTIISKVGGPLFQIIVRIAGVLVRLTGLISDVILGIVNFANESGIAYDILDAICIILDVIALGLDKLRSIFSTVASTVRNGLNVIAPILQRVGEILLIILALPFYLLYEGFMRIIEIDWAGFLDKVIEIKDNIVKFIETVWNLPAVQFIIDSVTSAFKALVGAVYTAIMAIKNGLRAVLGGDITIAQIREKILSIPESFREAIENIKSVIKNSVFFDVFGPFLSKMSSVIKDWTGNIKELLKGLTPAKLALIAFSGLMVMLAFQLNGLLTTLNIFATGLKSIVMNKLGTKLFGNIFTLSKAITALAVAFKLMSTIPTDKIKEVGLVLGFFLAEIVGLYALITVLDKWNNKLTFGLMKFSGGLLTFSLSVLILTAAFKTLGEITDDESSFKKRIALLAGIVAGLIGVCLLASKLKLSGVTGMLQLLAFSASVLLLTKALAQLNEVDLTKLKGSWKELAALLIGFGVLSKLMSGGISFAALLIVILEMHHILKQLNELSKDKNATGAAVQFVRDFKEGIDKIVKTLKDAIDNIKKYLDSLDALGWAGLIAKLVGIFIAIGVGIAGIVAALYVIGQAGKGLWKASLSIVMVGIVVAALIAFSTQVSKWMKENPNMIKAIEEMGMLIVAIGVFTALLAHTQDPLVFRAAQKMFRSVTGLILALGLFMLAVSTIPEDAFDRSKKVLYGALGIIAAMMVAIEVISLFTAQSVLVQKTFGMFAGITLLFAAMMGSLALLILAIKTEQDYKNAILGIIAVCGVIAALSVMFKIISGIPDSTHSIRLIWSLVGGMVVLAGAIVLFSRFLPEDYEKKIAVVAAAMLGSIIIIVGLATKINKITLKQKFVLSDLGIRNVLTTYIGIAAIAAGMVGVAAAIMLLKDVSWKDIATKGGMLIAMMALLSAIGLAIQGFSKKFSLMSLKPMAQLAIMEALFVGIAAIMMIVAKLPIDQELLNKCKLVTELMVALSIIGGVLGWALKGVGPTGIYTILTFTAVFGALVGLMWVVDKLGINSQTLGKATYVTLLLSELVAMAWLLKKVMIGVDPVSMDYAIVLLGEFTIIFAALSILAKLLDTMRAKDIFEKTHIISLIMFEFIGIMALLGIMSKKSLTAEAGIVAIMELTAVFAALTLCVRALRKIRDPGAVFKLSQGIVLIIAEFTAIIAGLALMIALTEGIGLGVFGLATVATLCIWPLVEIFKALAKVVVSLEAIKDADQALKKAGKINLLILELGGVLMALGAMMLIAGLPAIGSVTTLCMLPLVEIFRTLVTMSLAMDRIKSIDSMVNRANVILGLMNIFKGMLTELAALIFIATAAEPAIAALHILASAYYVIGAVSVALDRIRDPEALYFKCKMVLAVMLKLVVMTKVMRDMGSVAVVANATACLYLLSSAFAVIAIAARTVNGIDTDMLLIKLDILMTVMRKLVYMAAYLSGNIKNGQSAIAGSFGLAAMAAGVYLLAQALVTLSAVPYESLMSSINVVEAGLTALLNAVQRAVNLSIPLIAFGFGMIECGVACAAAGYGIAIAGKGILYLAEAIKILATTTPSELQMVGDVILTFCTSLGEGIEIIIARIALGIAARISIITKSVLQNVALAIEGIVLIIHKETPKIEAAVDEVLTAIERVIANHPIIDSGKNIVRGFSTGLKDKSAIAEVINAALVLAKIPDEIIRKHNEIASPSKRTYRSGTYTGIGFGDGIKDAVDYVKDASGELADGAMEGMNVDTLIDWFHESGLGMANGAAEGIVSGYSSYEAAWQGMVGIAQKYCSALETYQYNLNAQVTMYNQQYLENSRIARYWQTKIGNENYKNQNLANANYKLYSKRAEDARKKELEFTQQQDELNARLNGTTEAAEDAGDAITELGDSLDKTTKKTGGAAKATKDFAQSLEQTLVSQMNIFDKFEAKTAMSKEELLSNMQSQINGMTNWAANMDKLSTMGIDKGLYQKLAEMGPQGAQYVGAFANMTAEEMARANELWAQSLVLPGDVAGKISADWAGISGDMVNGLSKGWTDSEGIFHKNILDTSQEGQEVMKEDNGIHSPSTVYRLFGQALMLGLRFGMWDERSLLLETLTTISEMMIKRANELLNEETLVDTGKNLIKGLAKGLKDESVLKELEDASEEVAEIPDRVTRKHNLIESPSKLFMQHGKYIDKGLAMGLLQNQGLVSTAMDEVNNTVLDSMKYTIATIATTLQDGIEDPVITPVLDLSRVSSGIRTLNSVFSTNQALAAAGSMSSLQNGQPVAGVQFIQNNYSPKALSRADIYRQTRNQFAQYRRAMS